MLLGWLRGLLGGWQRRVRQWKWPPLSTTTRSNASGREEPLEGGCWPRHQSLRYDAAIDRDNNDNNGIKDGQAFGIAGGRFSAQLSVHPSRAGPSSPVGRCQQNLPKVDDCWARHASLEAQCSSESSWHGRASHALMHLLLHQFRGRGKPSCQLQPGLERLGNY